MPHNHQHAFRSFNARQREGLLCASRRNFLKAGLAGIEGLTVPRLLQAQDRGSRRNKSVILLWMAGGQATSTRGT